MTFNIPCLFGLEGLVADELRRLGMPSVRPDNGHVAFDGSELDLARANIHIATGERVLLLIGETAANTFDELFEGVRRMPWAQFIPRDGAFPVAGYARNSKLHSIPDCQKIIKKSVAATLGAAYGLTTLPETAATYQIRFSIVDDRASLYLDTSGAGLHKRGYRPQSVAAPLRETLAAAMVKLARYRGRETFRDPFCGSGTIPIEAALAAKNRAVGLNRRFAAEQWATLDAKIWTEARDDARAREYNGTYNIVGGDIDPESIKIARENAARAGVSDCVRFEVADAREFGNNADTSGVIVTNPPYGERVMERDDAAKLYREFGASVRSLKDWKLYILSSHTEFEREFGRVANKKRKLYNGMIKCDLYMY
ncbi:MAG: class I SAM-dependent RNA methyltransferase [Oscillospiraceae bacterium]|jgi:putative N6-adenine-specific DNA methylase|nr:class I SAM-dependent RNA methyltransferase [Oscillospiraceae bacterium]